MATAGHSDISLNFGISEPFMFDVNMFEMNHYFTCDQKQTQWPNVSAYYMHHICTMRPASEQRLKTQYISQKRYIKKDTTYSLFADNSLIHETLMILDPKTYKNQGTAILSDSEEDSSDDEGS